MKTKDRIKKTGITYEILHDLLQYDEDDGKLFWKIRPEKYFPHPRYASRWNAKHAGKEAGIEFGYPNSPNRYIRVRVFQHNFRAHRLIWWMIYGALPSLDLDHEDHDGTNNRLGNLRMATRLINQKNLSLSKGHKTGTYGVKKSVSKRTGRVRWVADICCDNKFKRIGTFDTKRQAISARKKKEKELGFHSNHGK